MKLVPLPFEDFLGYPSRDYQGLQSTVAGVRSWGDFVFQTGTYAQREAISAPQRSDLFLQTDAGPANIDGVIEDPPGLYHYYNSWTPLNSLYETTTDKFYPVAVTLLDNDPAQPQLAFLSPR